MKTIALAHPITVNGKERSTINLDFEALTVDAFTRADSRSHGGEGNVLTLMEANGTLHLNLAFEAAIAADQTLDITDLERLKGADIMKFAAAGRFFTLQSATDSQGETFEAQSESTDESTTTPRAK